MHINWKLREIDIKIVYYGPPLSGKTTNLEQIHARMAGPKRSELVSLKTSEDRTLFFDFLPLEVGQIGNLKPRFNLYTVPGQSLYRATRRLILEEVDGLVFVADSQRSRLADNERSLREMKRHLQALGYRWFDIPLVLQYNKRDLSRVSAESTLQRRLNPDGSLAHFSSVAIDGSGVIETLKHIINMVLTEAQKAM
ncbi:MAG: GTPase domain-containing protein [Chloroflexota bacterium]|nr:GTPase domain-containing protein [Chloroflexota bacterium]